MAFDLSHLAAADGQDDPVIQGDLIGVNPLDIAVVHQISLVDADKAVGLGERFQLFHGHLDLQRRAPVGEVEQLVVSAALNIADLLPLQGEQAGAGGELDVGPVPGLKAFLRVQRR